MEILDVVDENGMPTGDTVERTKAHRDGIPHRTSHVWLFRRRHGRVQLLLQKRSASKDSYPGCYDISSAGHIPAGQDCVSSALRELNEELGISAGPDDLIYCGKRIIEMDSVFYGQPFHDLQVSSVYAMECSMDEHEFTVQKSEVDSVLWMDYDECVKKVRSGSFPNCIYTEELEMLRQAF